MALLVLGATLAVRRWILSRLSRDNAEGYGRFLLQIRSDIKTPSLLWCLVITLEAMLGSLHLSERAERLGHNLIVSFLIISITMVAASVLVRLMQRYGEESGVPFVVAGLTRSLARVFFYSIGLLILLRFLGISITPVLTALGVGGLAVALALQDTLANLFAGIHLLIERPITVGDFIRLSADEEGTVADIGWRTTRLVTGTNATIVVPNKTITSGNLLNYSMPDPTVSVNIPILVGFKSNLEQVERIVLAAAAANPDVLPEPPPILIPDPGFQATYMQYKLIFRIPMQTRSGGIRMAVLKAILAEFEKAKVPPPDIPGL